ncbi:MAG: BspA family leucine-rich repeat surface protein, partial [Paracoccaceae bacterium]|nr:BspA family leucine-rich repeat surface protein [Paracoccaceae bacterium]
MPEPQYSWSKKRLIRAQNSNKVERSAFYLGNVGLTCTLIWWDYFVKKMKRIYKLLASILFAFISNVAVISSAYAECIVDGTSYNVGGTGIDSASGAGGAITRAIIKDDWDTSGDDVSTCDVSAITDMSDLFKDNTTFNQNISAWDT